MDFFGEQDRARRSTRVLVLLLSLAVAAIIAAIYLSLVAVGYGAPDYGQRQWWQPELLLFTALGVGLLTGTGSLFKIAQLSSGGGTSVALGLGGRPVLRETDNRLERRLLNVVDEMAIASGVPVPQVFVLSDQSGINAFAAGTTPNNAVVAVTRGALEQLSRDELQGVVAHEFSHIFNGDMRLNLRIIGLLHGILLLALAGRLLLRGGAHSRSRQSGGIAVAGLVLLLVGYIGVFFGRIIKAAVSRQREFLADAAAVQYTRNPAGIAGALKKIGLFDTTVDHPRAEEASHLFFAQGLGLAFGRLFATHPPLEARIARLDPAFAEYRRRRLSEAAAGRATESPAGAMGFAAGQRLPLTADAVVESIGNPAAGHTAFARQVIGRLGEQVRSDLNRPERVDAVLYGLAVAGLEQAGRALRTVLDDQALIDRALAHARGFRRAGRELWLPAVELALPTLEELSPDAVDTVVGNVEKLVAFNGRISIFEFALTSVLHHALNERRPAKRGREPEIRELHDAVGLLLSLLAHAGHRDAAQAKKAFENAAAKAPLQGPWHLQPQDRIGLPRLEAALERLGPLNLRFKKKIIEACVEAVVTDNSVTVTEAELLRAIGARLDVPVPPILPGPLRT